VYATVIAARSSSGKRLRIVSNCSRVTNPARGGLRANWNTWLPQIRPHVTPDLGVTPDTTPYAGNTFKKDDLEKIPPRDLPFGVPKWMGTGDMAWRASPTQIAWKSLAADG
jgi:hypothetical protein